MLGGVSRFDWGIGLLWILTILILTMMVVLVWPWLEFMYVCVIWERENFRHNEKPSNFNLFPLELEPSTSYVQSISCERPRSIISYASKLLENLIFRSLRRVIIGDGENKEYSIPLKSMPTKRVKTYKIIRIGSEAENVGVGSEWEKKKSLMFSQYLIDNSRSSLYDAYSRPRCLVHSVF